MNSSRWASLKTEQEKQCFCGGGEPRRILKYMHAYHIAQMAASCRSRFMLLDSLSLTVSWTLIHNWSWCGLWWRLSNINKSAQVHIIFAENGSCHWKCGSYDLQILCFRCSLSWLTHIAQNPCWSEILLPAGRSLVNQQRVSFSVLQICWQLYHLRVWRRSI